MAEGGGRAGAALDAGLTGLAAAYRQGCTPAEVVAEVVRRIDADDDPAVWIHREHPDALAAAVDAIEALPDRSHPLWGVPFAVKDNIDVAGRPTSCALLGPVPVATCSATVVERLLAVGALYVGKTNLDQLATGLVGTRSPYGTPRNPFDASLVPGGSSSGSAVAVARGQVVFALGTDTAGSGRVPAALCGVVGAKGAPGSRPVDGVAPASPTLDCVSTFARSVADALVVESVLAARPWPAAAGPWRVAVADEVGPAFVDALRVAGHTLVAVDLSPFHEAGDLLYGGPWLADRTAALAARMARASGLDPVVAEVVAGGHAYRGTEVFEAITRLRRLRRALRPFWAVHDALVVPTVAFAPTLAEVAADPVGVNVALGRHTTFANLLGLAAVAVPDRRGPGGVTVLAPTRHQAALAAVALACAGEDLPVDAATAGEHPAGEHLVAVVGAHLSGQPLNGQLVERGATLVARTTTAPAYRLHRLAGAPPLRPGLERVAPGGQGRAVEVEVWRLGDAALGALVGEVPPPLGIGSVELADGGWVRGFICEPVGLAGATDITDHGGWRAYLADLDRRP